MNKQGWAKCGPLLFFAFPISAALSFKIVSNVALHVKYLPTLVLKRYIKGSSCFCEPVNFIILFLVLTWSHSKQLDKCEQSNKISHSSTGDCPEKLPLRTNNANHSTWSWPSGWCTGLRSKLRGFDAQLGHLHDACTSLPQKSSAAIKWLEIKNK